MDKFKFDCRGGQASGPGVFGCPSIAGRPRRFDSRPAQRPAPSPAKARRPWTSRVKGALNPGDRDGLSPAHYGEPDVTPAHHILTIPRGSFQAFVRLSEREQRPVEEVMEE